MPPSVLQSWYRFLSCFRVSWASSVFFATMGTAVVSLCVIPLLNVVFALVMGGDLGSPHLVRTGYAACLVALCTSIASGVVAAVAMHRNHGVFFEIQQFRRFDPSYWCAITVAPAVLAVGTAIISMFGVFVFDQHHDANQLLRALALIPITAFCGALLGMGAAGMGVNLSDPYLGSTILGAILPVLAGVIVPTTAFPDWLHALSWMAPLRGVLNSLGPGEDAGGIVVDLGIAVVWAALGMGVVRLALHRLRQGHHFRPL